ncbi:MAG: hypothetical protein LBL59_03070 [Xanthomonadaceae bacterium]|jgi:alpha-tubulin suppressor-like RCC1 family protein|nr:hypothetical protein [Xanthomonadaceae bacterium]
MRNLIYATALIGVTLAVHGQASLAGNVLVVNGGADTFEPETTVDITRNLQVVCSGNNQYRVTSSVPSNLSAYQQIWDLRYDGVITPEEHEQYLRFLRSGKRMFVMGENGGFQGRNNSVIDLIEAAGGGLMTFAKPGNIQTIHAPFDEGGATLVSYRNVGGVVSPGTGAFISSGARGGTGVSWDTGTLEYAPRGLLTVMFDVNFMESKASVAESQILQNLCAYVDQGGDQTGTLSTTLITTGAAVRGKNVYVWGFRGSSQQGNGRMVVDSRQPAARVESLSDIRQMTGGAYHLLALDGDGSVYGWGQSGYGETGCPGFYVSTPCKVMSNAVQVAAGEYTSFALTADGGVYAWGHNLYGQLGSGNRKNSNTPLRVDLGGERARLIGAAYEGAFAVTEEGHVWAWGDNEASGLGVQGSNYGVQRIVDRPIRVPNLEQYAGDIVHIAGGNGWGEVLLADGRVLGWGLSASIGMGTHSTASSSPMPRVIMDNVRQLFARYVGSFALTNGGNLYTWGQTGGSAFSMVYGESPTLRQPVSAVSTIGGGKEHLFYETEDGKLFGVGYNDLYKLNQAKCCAPSIGWPGQEIRVD